MELLDRLNPGGAAQLRDALNEVAPGFADTAIAVTFGNIYQREGLDLRTRELVTIAGLTTMGNIPQLQSHVRAALNAGCAQKEIVEAIVQMSIYAGFPAALNGIAAAKEVFAGSSERPLIAD